MFFTQEWREKIKEENPGISFGEVAKKLGAKWKEMTDEEKEASRAISFCVHSRIGSLTLIVFYSPTLRSTKLIRSVLKTPRRLTRYVLFPPLE
jgi:hypothetical protein